MQIVKMAACSALQSEQFQAEQWLLHTGEMLCFADTDRTILSIPPAGQQHLADCPVLQSLHSQAASSGAWSCILASYACLSQHSAFRPCPASDNAHDRHRLAKLPTWPLQHGTELSIVPCCAHPSMHTPAWRLQAGDKVLQVSASFGADVWDAKNYGQVMYAIKTRNGEVYMRMQRRGGDMSILEVGRSLTSATS